jgi:hypothetical protein
MSTPNLIFVGISIMSNNLKIRPIDGIDRKNLYIWCGET